MTDWTPLAPGSSEDPAERAARENHAGGMRCARERRHPAPKKQAHRHQPPFREPVADLARNGRAKPIHPQEN